MAIHKVFKGEKKGDELRVCYLYRDGHVVSVFEKAGSRGAQYVKIAKSVGINSIAGDFQRIVFHSPTVLLAFTGLGKQCNVIGYVPSEKHGSNNTKAANMKVGYVSFHLPEFTYQSHCIHETPMISGGITIQNETTEFCSVGEEFNPTVKLWNDYPVVKIYE